MAALNHQYRGRAGPTNVLAFAMQEGAFCDVAPDLLGDVVISVQTCEREARTAGVDFDHRFDELLVHGILHLMGYDHERSAEENRRMRAKTDQLLSGLAKARKG